jgi:hypothetical protein
VLRPFTPVLQRGDSVLQVGLDQEPTLLLSGVSPGLGRVLLHLDGRHTLVEIRSYGLELSVPPEELEWALRRLQEAGLLSDAGADAGGLSALDGRRIRLVGAGPLGLAVATLLVNGGLSHLTVVDVGDLEPSLYPGGGALGTQAEGLAAALADRPTRISVPNHWSKPDGVQHDLTVVASDRLECDRVVAEGLLRTDQPHLLLRGRGGGAVVGPLIVPGETACLRCTDLARSDADPGWPTLLPQLMRARSVVTPVLAGWAAGVAAAQVLAFLNGHRPESLGATLEVAPPDHLTRRRSWVMHPRCGCGWGVAAEWAP